jgi:glycine oxidase
MISRRAGIVGGGVLGTFLGWHLLRRGWSVTLWDGGGKGRVSCSYAAAGMLAPFCELESADPLISSLGEESLEMYPSILRSLGRQVFFQREGSLVVAHSGDGAEYQRLLQRLEKNDCLEKVRSLDREGLLKLEPDLPSHFSRGLYFALEGQVDNRDLLAALRDAIGERGELFPESRASIASNHHIVAEDRDHYFDWVFDCRGLLAKESWPELRGVKGEILRVKAPKVSLSRPIRLLHPKYPLYVVPRPDSIFVVGATSVESSIGENITVLGALELLSSLYSLHAGFAEAEIQEATVQFRPAFFDNRPRIKIRPGLMRLNGLYRHGFLIAPRFTELAADLAEGKSIPHELASLVEIL